MSQIFLGKLWRWLLLAVASGVLWFGGSQRLHVIEFNLFILSTIAGTVVLLLAIVWFHRDGEQITRDPLVAQEFDPDADMSLSRE